MESAWQFYNHLLLEIYAYIFHLHEFFQNFVFLAMIKSKMNDFVVAAFFNSSFSLPLLPSSHPQNKIYTKKKKKKTERKQENVWSCS